MSWQKFKKKCHDSCGNIVDNGILGVGKSRRGSQKATIALAHQLLKIAYILLKEQITYPEFLAQKKTTRDELVA